MSKPPPSTKPIPSLNSVEDSVRTYLQSELAKAEYEPLLPIEKKLIGWSLGIGITLLVVLALVSRVFPAHL